MKKWQNIVTHTDFRLLDHTKEEQIFNEKNNAITSFALDDALTLSVGEGLSKPIVRLWSHDETIVLGIPDSRLPYIEDGLAFLKNQGYRAIVRNSGGLAVALDRGVLNISIILPNVKEVSIDDGFKAMFHFVRQMFSDLTKDIKAYEIVGSYCPGDYDLSIDGIKFAGISQRRVRDAAAIQIYLDVEGDSYERASLVRQFYDLSLGGEETKFSYPQVNPEVLGSLAKLLQIDLRVEDVIKRVEDTLGDLGEEIRRDSLTREEEAFFKDRYEQMIKRNERVGIKIG